MSHARVQRKSGKTVQAVACAVALAIACATAAYAQTWNHDPSSPNGPNHWGLLNNTYNAFATCGTSLVEVGKKQTPINIVTSAALKANLKNIGFSYRNTPFIVSNTLHVVEVGYEPGSVIRTGPALSDEYTLQQFHFHAPSEHMINGQLADAELHLVHINSLGEQLVVSVLLRVDDRNANHLFDRIMFGAPIGVTEETEHDLHGEINAEDLLPKSRSFYTYTGSLTTPPCTEGVNWFVMAEPASISSAAVAQLHAIIHLFPDYGGYSNNNRPVHDLNSRTVFFNQQ
jgi:carbonic anhydrase